MDPYLVLKFAHVLSAIVALGFNISYSVWVARAARAPAHLAYVLETARLIDVIANVFYGILLVTGLAMVAAGGLDLRSFWLGTALVLYVLAVVVGVVLFAPAARRQRQTLASHGPASDEYRRAESRSRLLGMATGVIVLAILYLMVTKPTPFVL